MQLSTRFTFTHKVIMPAAWLAFFGVGLVVLLLRPEQDRQRTLSFALALAVGAFTFWNWAFPLRKVIAGPTRRAGSWPRTRRWGC